MKNIRREAQSMCVIRRTRTELGRVVLVAFCGLVDGIGFMMNHRKGVR